ncbi:LOW QUALITY PROTEIN: glucose-6-phosphate exchanger SLC37A2-like [Macrobrachium rosenbergii]|uniref:LOW QUALITY PROTEIN: glucose-6-phosphate exchanger SLC37A2-like n=1 Tax=Macrobrachium rosenbergii TaxID=79674 RepID=UPI0034D6B804
MAKLTIIHRAIDKLFCTGLHQSQKILAYKALILSLTFFVYCSYHINRKPTSVVKNVLNRNCTGLIPPKNVSVDGDPYWCDWEPFDTDDSSTLLGFVDSSFLFAYAFGIFVSGAIAERMDLRIFLGVGMLLSGCFNVMFGLGYTFGIHQLWYFLLAQILSGLAQSSGWPGVVAAVGKWYGKSSRGFIFGVWNSHVSIGNILGTLIAAAFVDSTWSMSFIVPGIIIAAIGVIVLLVMVPEPSLLGLPDPNEDDGESSLSSSSSTISYIGKEKEEEIKKVPEIACEEKAISIIGALRIPGVIEFSLCLFFAKLVSYTFLYWLPNYIKYSTSFGASESANLSTLFDVGGIIGGILAGILKDFTGRPATTCVGMLLIAVPMLFVYYQFAYVSFGLIVFLLVVLGVLVNGPYSLITTAVSADLGTHESLKGNAKALATVAAIIDGTGSIGAAVGPLLAGTISEIDWGYVFYMLMASDVLALLLLLRLVVRETQEFLRNRRTRHHSPV